MANEKRSRDQLIGLGKIPPSDVEMEEAILGAILLEKDAILKIYNILQVESFYKHSHQLIFAVISEMFSLGQPIDILTVTNRLREKGELTSVGGAYVITMLSNRVNSSANIEYHAHIIAEHHLKREVIAHAHSLLVNAYEDTVDIFETLDKAQSHLLKVNVPLSQKSSVDTNSLVRETLELVDQRIKDKIEITGIPTGLSLLDSETSGFNNSDLIIIAARPGMGKTTLILNIAINCTIYFNNPVGFFSLEMSRQQLMMKCFSVVSGIYGEVLIKGRVNEQDYLRLTNSASKLLDSGLVIDDTPSLSINQLRAKAYRLKTENNIKMIIVDYLQLMSGDRSYKGGSREQEISSISRGLKLIAKELEIPVVALAQLSRANEQRGGEKKPMLSDLRESGAIEQDADQVMFLHRPEYYGITETPDGTSTRKYAELIIAKNRHGPTGEIPLKAELGISKFSDWNTYQSTNDIPPPSENTYPKSNFDNDMNDNDDNPF